MNDQQYKKDLLNIHRRRLQEREKQQATQGISTPPEIKIEIEDIKAKIQELENSLHSIESETELSHKSEENSSRHEENSIKNTSRNHSDDKQNIYHLDVAKFIFFIHDVEPLLQWFYSGIPQESAAKYLSCLQILFFSNSNILYPKGDWNLIRGNKFLLEDMCNKDIQPSNDGRTALLEYLYFVKRYRYGDKGKEDSNIDFTIFLITKNETNDITEFLHHLNYVYAEIDSILKLRIADISDDILPIRLSFFLLQHYERIIQERSHVDIPFSLSNEIQKVISNYFENTLHIRMPTEFDDRFDLDSLSRCAWDELNL